MRLATLSPLSTGDWQLLRILRRPRFADDRHLDLARVLHRVLDLLGDGFAQLNRGQIVDRFRLDHHANFTSGLNGISFFHTRLRFGNVFQIVHPAQECFDILTPRAWPRTGNGVGHFHDDGLQALLVHRMMMGSDGIQHFRIAHAKTLDEIRS